MEKSRAYQLEIAEVASLWETNLRTGLTSAQVEARRAKFGYNELEAEPGKSIWQMFFDQFKEFLVILLFLAAIVSGFLGEWIDSVVIMAIVVVNAFLGVFQEFRAEKSLAALKKLAAPMAKVLRDGHIQEIPARELTPGDVFIIEAGDFVPADGRLFETVNLKVEESALTGESVPVEKSAAVLHGELPLGDQQNMVFMSTVVTYGRAKGIVVRTGMDTEIGQIASLIQAAVPESTPLQKKLEEFGKYLGSMALIICALIFVIGWFRGENPVTMFLTSVSLAVAAIPEGLPAIVTIVLAIGVQKMAKQHAIIRKLPAVETLGAATVICSDKTGTLTQNQMTVKRLYAAGEFYEATGEGYNPEGEFLFEGKPVNPTEKGPLQLLLLSGLLCNDAILEQETIDNKSSWKIIGDPTEGALMVVAAKAGMTREALKGNFQRVLEIPFDSDRKLMTTIHKGNLPENYLKQLESANPAGLWAITKGAPGMLLERSASILTPKGIIELTPDLKKELLAKNSEMAKKALRVLGVAVRRLPKLEEIRLDEVEQALVFIGFWGMIDPPRPEAKAAIIESRNAGIKPVMITGDHQDTATAIAQELGLLREGEMAVNGRELDNFSDEELAAKVERISVYARVSPEHKVRIVNIFRNKGHVVAMTGDGVNDAPALKRADIGAAMGITGTDVAKSASEMVLADDNFATIVGAVREGRVIFENIKKAVYFLLSCNIGEIFTIFLAIILQYPMPLLAIQILWINLVTDGLPALALGVDPAEPGIMDREPRSKDQGIFTVGMKRTIFIEGFVIGCFALLAFAIGKNIGGNLEQGRTMAFATLSLSQLFHVFNFRSIYTSIFRKNVKANNFLIGASLVSGLIQITVMVTPFLQPIFKVVPLDSRHWLYILALSAAPIPLVELWKATYLKKYARPWGNSSNSSE
ncbi:MAG: cation-translocating P-type ATPase [Bacillota bacterium]